MKNLKQLVIAIAALSTTLSVAAKDAPTGGTSSGDESACRTFVQDFYNWYAPRTQGTGRTMDDPLKLKSASFDPTLLKLLKEDSAAQAKSKDEIVGLDFDPFLNSQDPAKKYVVRKVKAKGNAYLVDVFEGSASKNETKPSVTAEVAQRNGRWQFINFHYGKSDIPENENLLNILKVLKKDRQG